MGYADFFSISLPPLHLVLVGQDDVAGDEAPTMSGSTETSTGSVEPLNLTGFDKLNLIAQDDASSFGLARMAARRWARSWARSLDPSS